MKAAAEAMQAAARAIFFNIAMEPYVLVAPRPPFLNYSFRLNSSTNFSYYSFESNRLLMKCLGGNHHKTHELLWHWHRRGRARREMMSSAITSSLARAVNALRPPYVKTATQAVGAASWMTSRQASQQACRLPSAALESFPPPPPSRSCHLLSGPAGVGYATAIGVDRSAALLGLVTLSGSSTGRTGAGANAWLLQPKDQGEPNGPAGWSTEDSAQFLSLVDTAEELPVVVLPDGWLGPEAVQVEYEAMNRNNRKPKAANHGKRPCSRWRRRRKTYGINPDGSKK